MKVLMFLALASQLFTPVWAWARTAPVTLTIDGDGVAVKRALKLSDPGESHASATIEFSSRSGQAYHLHVKHKDLPDNRSYPGNLDITLKDAAGKKLGYLFFANNGIAALQGIGTLGFIVAVDGKPMDVKLRFSNKVAGNLHVAELGDERLISDTLVPRFGFQMIRPMLLPETQKGVRSRTYSLDAHPYAMNYTLRDLHDGMVQFQYNLYARSDNGQSLLARFYYNADSLANLREGMFAGKYFDPKNGTFKLVYYPAMGQTEPPQAASSKEIVR